MIFPTSSAQVDFYSFRFSFSCNSTFWFNHRVSEKYSYFPPQNDLFVRALNLGMYGFAPGVLELFIFTWLIRLLQILELVFLAVQIVVTDQIEDHSSYSLIEQLLSWNNLVCSICIHQGFQVNLCSIHLNIKFLCNFA